MKKFLTRLNQRYTAVDKPILIKYLLALSSISYILFPKFYYTLLLWNVSPFLIFIPSIIISAWYGGLLPGLFATIIGILIGDYYFLHPYYTFTISSTIDILRVVLFGFIGTLISLISQRFHTERIKAQTVLNTVKLSEERFRLLADSAPVMIWMADEKGNYTFCNQQWIDFRGKTLSHELGNGWMEGIHIDDIKNFRQSYLRAYAMTTKFTTEYRLKRADGKFRWVMDNGVPRFDTNNNFIGFIGVCVDITEKKNIENQKSNFLSIVSHELKTPITIIRVIIYDLADRYKKIVDKDMLTDLKSELERITILVEDLLDISKVERGKLSIEKANIDIVNLIVDVIKRIRLITTTHEIRFSHQNNYFAIADGARIKQVMLNLIENAIKNSPANTAILVSITEVKDKIIVSIADKGHGIAIHHQKHIFDIFYQVKKDETRGFGLGLYISKEIITLHQGEIWVTSDKGKGSTFSFSLPKS